MVWVGGKKKSSGENERGPEEQGQRAPKTPFAAVLVRATRISQYRGDATISYFVLCTDVSTTVDY